MRLTKKEFEGTKWVTRRLDEILTPEEIQTIWWLGQRYAQEEPELLKALREYMVPLHDRLLKNGVDSRFLTYLLFAKLTGLSF